MSVHGAARRFNVPLTTLRDRVDGRVDVDSVSSGAPSLFTQEEEAFIVEHVKSMAEIGYGYTRAEVIHLASDYAIDVGLRDAKKPLTTKWYYNFLKRWPELHTVKPSGLSQLRAKAASPECIDNYFKELDKILTKYDIKDEPSMIYNVDEKGIMTGGSKPPNIVAAKGKVAQVVTSERSQTVTVLGCGNAMGTAIPPFFVFPGKRMLPSLLEGSTPGCDGTVSDTGYSNTEIFSHYVKNHFLKYVQSRSESHPLLLLYDGHRSHIGLSLIQWARQNNIILFVLPPHTSHILQPMDVGCFGPFETLYQQEAHKLMRKTTGRSITRYDVCSIACKVYDHALSPTNLRSAFKKSGIFPLNPSEISMDVIAPSLVYKGQEIIQNTDKQNTSEQDTTDKEPNSSSNNCQDFFSKRGGEVLKAATVAKQPRRNISSVVGGKAVTEDDTYEKIQLFKEPKSNVPKGKGKGKGKKKQVTQKAKTSSRITVDSQEPGTSGIHNDHDDDSEPMEIREEEKCCKCKLFEPKELRHNNYVELVKWAQCDKCPHWVHLKYCSSERVIRRGKEFVCIHC